MSEPSELQVPPDPAPNEATEQTSQRRHRNVSGGYAGPTLLAGVALLAVVAIALSVLALLRAPSDTSAQPADITDSQRAEAKATSCGAFETVRTAVSRNTNLVAPGGPEDVAGALAVAANARLSLLDGGQYLLARLGTATPTDLADAVRGLANGLLDIGAASMAGAQNTDPEQAARLAEAERASTRISELCQ